MLRDGEATGLPCVGVARGIPSALTFASVSGTEFVPSGVGTSSLSLLAPARLWIEQ